jgi:predicted permease
VILHAICARLRALISPAAADLELQEEMRFHFDNDVERRIAAGMSPREAHFAARRAFGNLTSLRAEARDAFGTRLIHDLLADVRHAARALRIRPTYTLTAVSTLALGIGATTAMFSIAYGVALRPLPYANADRLVTVCERSSTMPASICNLSPPNMLDVKRRAPSIEAIGLGRRWNASIGTPDGSEPLPGAVITPELLGVFGLRVQRGRLLLDSDMIGGPSTTAIISDALWHTRFGGDRVVGRSINLDGRAVTIVGILPPMVDIPGFDGVAIWRPLHFDPRDEANRDWTGFAAFGRLREGRPLSSARRELAVVAASLRTDHFSRKAGWDLSVVSVADLVLGKARHLLLLFLAAVAILLLVACANVANLMLAQAAGRRHEMGIRAAMGATGARLVRLQLTESFLISLIGTVAGLGIAIAGVRTFKHFAPPGLPRLEEVGINATVLAFAITVAALTALLCGIVPAIRASAGDTWQHLRDGGRTGTASRGRFGPGLVVVEIALATTLVAGAGLLTRSFAALSGWNPGIETTRITTFSLSAPIERFQDPMQLAPLWSAVERELRAIPGVESVASASAGPLFGGGDGAREFRLQGVDMPGPGFWYDVSPGFFHTMGVPVVRGRELSEQDLGGAPLVAVVNESFVRRYWPNAEAVGRHVSFGPLTADTTLTVVGVVRDVPSVTPGAPVEPQIYWSNRQKPRYFTYMLVRTATPNAALAAVVRERVRAVDHDLRPHDVETIADYLDDFLRRPRFNMLLLGAFGLTAMLLAGIGTYGLLAYHVSQRGREMAIRLALGAPPRQIAALVLRYGLSLAGAGLTIGVGGALLAGRSVSSLVQGVSPADPVTLVGAVTLLGAVTALACLVPAWRASHAEPAITLTGE